MTRHITTLHGKFFELADFRDKNFLFKVTNWPLLVKYREHSCSNAIVWTLQLINNVLEDVKNPYIYIESLRNTCSKLLDHNPVIEWNLRTFAVLRLWRGHSCGGVSALANAWLKTLPPWTRFGRMAVSGLTRTSNTTKRFTTRFGGIFGYMLQFQSVSETRWVKSCSSSRLVLRSFAVGLPSLDEHVKADKTVNL